MLTPIFLFTRASPGGKETGEQELQGFFVVISVEEWNVPLRGSRNLRLER